ncbi:MAG: hypothetical protein WC917_04490 [Bacilli bacterium]|jgi:hypothetical protein
MPQSYYFTQARGTGTGMNLFSYDGSASWGEQGTTNQVAGKVTVKTGISPILAFKYIKKKFGILENIILDRRLKKLEAAFYQAVDNGQEALGVKILSELARETRESALYAKGIRHFVEREDILKVKNKIKDGHISDTRLEEFTKIIPKNVLKKKKELEGVFDGFIIYHYYNEEIEKKIAKKQKRSPDEQGKMRDPILFGYIKESDRLYFVADWEDEYCDLTFDEIIDVVGDNKLTKYPKLDV